LKFEFDSKEGEEEECGMPLPDDEYGLLSCHRVKLFADGSLGTLSYPTLPITL
jgi:hypothetical protein